MSSEYDKWTEESAFIFNVKRKSDHSDTLNLFI